MTQEQEIIVGVLKCTDKIRKRLEACLQVFNITTQQFNVLRILRGALPEPLPVLTISDRMVEHCPGISRLLERIATKGFIERKHCTQDRRIIYCHITPTGLQLLRASDQAVLDCEQQALFGLSDNQKKTLLKLLKKLAAVDS